MGVVQVGNVSSCLHDLTWLLINDVLNIRCVRSRQSGTSFYSIIYIVLIIFVLFSFHSALPCFFCLISILIA